MKGDLSESIDKSGKVTKRVLNKNREYYDLSGKSFIYQDAAYCFVEM